MAFSPISKSSTYFNSKLYTGNGGTQSITGVGFQADLIWCKSRSTDNWHSLSDSVNGMNVQFGVNGANAADNFTTAITALSSDGFTLGSNGNTNGNGRSLVAWNWKAGTTGSGTTTGAGTGKAYSYSVSTTSGVSIVKYKGNGTAGHTIPHHLGAVPKFIIVKRIAASPWHTYHVSKGNTIRMSLNETDSAGADSTAWNNTTPTSSVFTVGNSGTTNVNDADTVAYCFAQVSGFSKFGKYQGTGSADGPFIFTGFKPGFIIFKDTEGSGNYSKGWHIYDSKRIGYNVKNYTLNTESSAAEVTTDRVDLLSNGFKLRTSSEGYNQSNNNYIYMAFAENPFVATSGSSAVPTTAR